MEMEILELTDTKAKFVIAGVTPPTVNALRRTLISDVPRMAIENIEFHLGPIRDEHGKEYESATPLFDEIIAHRLGMVPVPTDLDLFVFKKDCVCGGEGCPNCTIMYSLNKKGPSEEDGQESITVYSDELQLVVQKVEGVSEKKYSDKFQIKNKIPIVKLNTSQALLLYATAELGTGRKHAKWQVAHAAGYQYYPEIEIDMTKCDSGASCVAHCPKNVFVEKDKEIIVEDLESCTLCNACVEACSLDAISVRGDDTRFIFQFETDGAITAKGAIIHALDILEEEFEELRDLASKLK
jgi:DNA-directed RNA polymerase subunit D